MLFLASCALPGTVAGADAPGAAGRLELTLEQAIFLALKNSRAAIAARLGREEQELSLEAAEERYLPRASVGVSANARNRADPTASVRIGPSLRVPTGGTFSLSWSKPLIGEGDLSGSTSLTFRQPLLKGFGPEIDTWPLRQARLQERFNVRAFRDTAAGVIRSVIGAYRGVLSARRRVVIAQESLERARRQLEINRALVEAGRMARQDLVQTEAEVANKEYALIDRENSLEDANSNLVNILDLEEGAGVEPLEEPAVVPERPDLKQSLKTAFARRTDWLRAELGIEIARMEFRVAKDNLRWDLSLDARASYGCGGQKDYSAGLNLTVPLGNDGPRRALLRAKNGMRRAMMALAETRQRVRIQVRRAVQGVAVALRRIDLAGAARELAARKLEIERLKLQQGLSSAFQVGRFEGDLVNAQRRELDAVVGYRNALDSLGMTLGTTLDRWGIKVEQVGR